MMNEFPQSASLDQQCLHLLQQQPDGLPEYALLHALRKAHSSHLPNLALSDKLVLFRSHFLLFNALYRLRDQLWQAERAYLHIDPLNICLMPYQAGSQAVSEHDPLRAYYLDEQQLRETDERDVERLLTSFWTRMQGGEEKLAAIELFELDEPITPQRIKQRYRQLVSLHHPDRGGSQTRMQSINHAFEILERYYGQA
ncbi:DNA-J related domain-containing protein [Atopomonas sediminilitoris]|uniref:DNA-J related domain-containing protein n=1 Tax=Atopomonas sediminilitoris TaxID=2919919 RepID=UPI001F4ED42B|nr:DNA-J related domain-containing protein [Atopomonas sediminilitoris]MCJ8168558.1 DnaJ domain-containing protein [Atopomonas sediminilitoris]